MSMGKRKRRARQTSMWVATQDLPRSAAHPFYRRLNRVLDEAQFDAFVEGACATFYAEVMGRPSLAPGRYFRLLLLGYFEGLDGTRDRLARRGFVARAELFGAGAAGTDAGSHDDLAHASPDRSGDAS